MKKIILSALFALSAIAFMPNSSNAQTVTGRTLTTPEPTNALAAWSAGYQYGISHGWGQEDSLWWAKVQMQIWINKHT